MGGGGGGGGRKTGLGETSVFVSKKKHLVVLINQVTNSKNLKYDTSSFNCETAMNLSLVLKACKGLV